MRRSHIVRAVPAMKFMPPPVRPARTFRAEIFSNIVAAAGVLGTVTAAAVFVHLGGGVG